MNVPRFWRYRGKIIDIENEDQELGTLQEVAAEVLRLRADNADLLSACEGALAMLDELFPLDKPALIAENRARLQAAIARAKGE